MPLGSNCAGSLLSPKLSLTERLEHAENLLNNSHRPNHIARAEGKRREAIAFGGALALVITSDDYATSRSFDGQVNMDIDSMFYPTSDGRKYVKEFNHTPGSELGFAPHNVSCKLKLKVKTCSDRNGTLSWKNMFQEIARVMDREMRGKIDRVAQICVSLSFQ